MTTNIRNFQQIQPESEGFYWHPGEKDNGFWSIIRPLGIAVQNLCANPSFENDAIGATPPAGWVETGLAASVVAQGLAYRGVKRAQVVGSNGSFFGYDFTGYNIARDYCATFYIKAADASAVGVSCIAIWAFALSGGQQAFTLTNEWQKVCVCIKAGAAGFPVQHNVGVQTNGNATYYIDAMTIIDVTGNNTIRCIDVFDGDAAGATWDGAPHASTSTLGRFAANYGERIYFNDIGFDVYGDAGWGLPPVENITQDFARGNGAHFQRQRFLPRTLTLTGIWQSCKGAGEVHTKRKNFIKSMLYRFSRQCATELLLVYQLSDSCGDIGSSELVIPVSYAGGLEGQRANLYDVRGAVQFVANERVFWIERAQNSEVLVQNGLTTVGYDGDADGFPSFIFINTSGGIIRVDSLINNTTGHGIFFGTLAAPGLFVAAGQQLRVGVTDRSFAAILNGVSVANSVDFTRSNASLFRLVPGENEFDLQMTPGGGETSLLWNNQYLSADAVRIYKNC